VDEGGGNCCPTLLALAALSMLTMACSMISFGDRPSSGEEVGQVELGLETELTQLKI